MKKTKTWILECKKDISKKDLADLLMKKKVSDYYHFEKLATTSDIDFYCIEEFKA